MSENAENKFERNELSKQTNITKKAEGNTLLPANACRPP